MNNIFDSWFEICDLLSGRTVDALEAIVLAVFIIPLSLALVYAFGRWWWSKRSHKIAVGLMLLMIIHLPVLVATIVIVTVRNREPLLEGTHRNMRKFRSKFAAVLLQIK